MTTKADEFALFVAVLAECDRLHPGPRGPLPPQGVVDRATAFRKMARSIERNAVAVCNGTATPTSERRALGAANAALKLAELAGVTPRLCGDPRGYALKLVLPTGRYNTWGGAEEGWGVPT